MKKIFLGFCFASILISCKKTPGPEGPAGPQGPAGPGSTSGTGIITGRVDQYDQFRLQYTSGLSSTTVSIDETNISAQTDVAGNYTLNNVPEGILDISYNKPGAGLSKHTQLVFPGKGTMYLNQSLYDKATYLLTGGVVKDSVVDGVQRIDLRLYYNPEPKSRNIIMIFGKSSNLTIDNSGSYTFAYSFDLPSNSGSYITNFSYANSDFNIFENGYHLCQNISHE